MKKWVLLALLALFTAVFAAHGAVHSGSSRDDCALCLLGNAQHVVTAQSSLWFPPVHSFIIAHAPASGRGLEWVASPLPRAPPL